MRIFRVGLARDWFHRKASKGTSGFTYVGLLILLAILSVTALGTVSLDNVIRQRQAEQELLSIGKEFRRAFILYAANTPQGMSRFPRTLEELARDARHAKTYRYIRKVYVDPLTGKALWGIKWNADGTGIVGVYSLAKGKPLKLALFDPEFEQFEKAQSYQDWIFASF